MRIVVAGQARSGTTALFFALKHSLPPNYLLLFEPRSLAQERTTRCVLAKILIDGPIRLDDFQQFDKKLLIVRDPRDNLVSRFLYDIYDSRHMNRAAIDRFIDELERKRADPQSISLVDLCDIVSRLSGLKSPAMRVPFDTLIAFGRDHPDYFIYKYEDFVAGNFDRLERHLGFEIKAGWSVAPDFGRVTRTKSAGDWKNWFTESDVSHYRLMFHDYLVTYGYEVDWELNQTPTILREHSTDYVRRLVRDKYSWRLRGRQLRDQLIRLLRRWTRFRWQ